MTTQHVTRFEVILAVAIAIAVSIGLIIIVATFSQSVTNGSKLDAISNKMNTQEYHYHSSCSSVD